MPPQRFVRIKIAILGIIVFGSFSSYGQLIVTGGQSGTQLADTLTGDGITVSNVTLNCPGGASGIFDGTNSNIGIPGGVLLTTGNINNAAGLNTTAFDFGTDNGSNGDPVLDFLAGAPTYDACALEFDIVATCDIIQIAYVFASEEYPNFVGGAFNDIFAFIITGPGIPPGGKNIALIPGTITPVSINNVNAGLNSNYYVSNPPQAGTTVKYNGFTTPLLAITQIQPCQTYHLKLVIADGTDGSYDSGVFLDLGGIKCFQNRTSLQAEYSISGSDHGVEGCNDVLLNIFRTGDSTQSKTVDFSLSGTATNGVDYTGMPASLIFPPLEDSLGIYLTIPDDGQTEGMEFLQIVVRDSLCNLLTTDTLIISIYDPANIDAGNDTVICVNSGSLTLSPVFSDPGGDVTWSPSAYLNDSTLSNPVFTPPGAGTYTYIAQFADTIGCPAADTIIIIVPPFSTAITSVDVDCFGAGTGSAIATVNGTSPYSYSWTDSAGTVLQTVNNTSAGTNTINNLGPGSYSVTITDGEGCSEVLTISITQPAAPLSATISNQVDILCNGDATGSVTVTGSGGTSPYEYSINGGAYSVSNIFNGLTAGTYSLSVRDSNNCTTVVTATLTEPTALVSSVISQSNVDCNGNATGSVTIGVSGGIGPYQYAIDVVNFGASATFGGLSAGAYTITIQDNNGCTQTQAITITEPGPLAGTITSQLNVDCNGNNTGSVDISGSGGTAPYQYSLNGGAFQTSGNFANLNAGTYTVTVQDDSLCTVNVPVTITEPTLLSLNIAGQTNVDCNGNSTGQVSVAANDGTTPYQYAINGGGFSGNSQFNNLPAGNYSIEVRDANNCSATIPVVITEPNVLTIAVTNRVDVDCFGNNTGSLSVVGNGGTVPYNFSLNNGTAGPSGTFNNLFAGIYTLTVQDAQGCTASVDTVITTPNGLTGGVDTLIHILCNGDATGGIDIIAQGGAMPYSYSLDGVNFVNNNSFSGLFAGPDTVTVMDANNCIFRIPFVLNEPPALQPVITANTPVDCNGNSTGVVTVGGSGGVLPYQYSLDGVNFQAGNTFNGLMAGGYTLTILDGNQCVQTLFFTVTEPQPLTVSTGVQRNVDCNGNATGAIDLIGNGGVLPYEFALDNGPFGGSASFSGLAVGVYSLKIRDANLCLDSISVTITEPQPLTGNISQQKNATCFGESNGWVDIVAGGGTVPYGYSVDGVNFQTSSLFTNLVAGSYTITIRDDSACIFQVPVTITEPQNLGLSVILQRNVDCAGNATGALDLSGTGGIQPYSYSLNGAAPQSSGQFPGLVAGAYTVIVTDDSLCSDTSQIQVTEPDTLTLAVDSILNVDCFGNSTGQVWFQAGGGTLPYLYTLSNGSNSSVSTFASLPAGNYTITVDDDSSCTETVSFTITEPPVLMASIAYQINVACNGDSTGEVGIVAQGGTFPYEYSLDGGPFVADSVVDSLAQGNYLVTVRDSQGCTFDVPILITEPPVLGIEITDSLHVDCFGNSTGYVTVRGLSGTPPYRYSLDAVSFQSSGTFQNLPAGTYLITVLDDSSCSEVMSYEVTEPQLLVAGVDTTINVDCQGNRSGSLLISAQGGTPPYSYSLNNGSLRPSGLFENLLAGSYQIIVQDGNGCRDTLNQVPVTEPEKLVLSTAHTDVLCHGGNTGTATVIPAGGVGPYSYLWEDGQDSSTAVSLVSGIYQVTVTDAQGCIAEAMEPVGEPDTLVLELTDKTDPFCDWNNGSASVAAQGGKGTYSYSWNTEPVQLQANATDLFGGLYLATVTDENGCTDTLSVFLRNTPPAVPDFGSQPDLNDSILLSRANIQFENQTIGGFVYEWDFGDRRLSDEENPRHVYAEPGEYTVTLTAYNEYMVCPVSISKTIHIIPDGVLYIPNAFTPNGDGTNDFFEVKGEGIMSLSLIIYDRWGKEIARLNHPDEVWDGRTFSGTAAPEGVYAYAVTAFFNSGTKFNRGGTITIIR